MSFGWLGTFRQGSWRSFRSFILHERRDAGRVIAVLEAEIARIGLVTVQYASTEDNDGNRVVTEQRVGISVTRNSSLSKLMQAYVALGGNPFDISLFLSPDATLVTGGADGEDVENQTLPSGGTIYPEDGTYTTGVENRAGYLSYARYLPARVGGRRHLEDTRVAGQVLQARRTVNQSIRYKRNDIEARIIKLCDLREQLKEELEMLTLAVAGTVGALGTRDTDQFEDTLSLSNIVAAIDSVFYEVSDDGTADFSTANNSVLDLFPNLLVDIPLEEDNNAL